MQFPLKRLIGDLCLFLAVRDGGVDAIEIVFEHDERTPTSIALRSPAAEAVSASRCAAAVGGGEHGAAGQHGLVPTTSALVVHLSTAAKPRTPAFVAARAAKGNCYATATQQMQNTAIYCHLVALNEILSCCST
ncbi:MAG: hypothetical protein KGH92_09895 [Xanthomonadaceae bacterium]|nr:hypothetical protein [Xanthomonadaceae bacterium]